MSKCLSEETRDEGVAAAFVGPSVASSSTACTAVGGTYEECVAVA